ncbi:MAG: hypothetical protein IJD28_03295 [Deferribacterales bacterium]|nr:hypothetical protein [Deferribacterales bacterium]
MFKESYVKKLMKKYGYMQKVPCMNIHLKDYMALLNGSVPENTDFFRVSSVVSLPSLFYNFKLQTKDKSAYFCICTALGNTDGLWAFLELATIGQYKILYYESRQEGPVSILRIEHINSETLRFTLISNKWLEHEYHSGKQTIQVTWMEFHQGGYGVNLDVLIKKKDFIHAFYGELWNIFCGDGSIPVEPEVLSDKIAQDDSYIIKNYLLENNCIFNKDDVCCILVNIKNGNFKACTHNKTEKLFSHSYKIDSEDNIIYHKPPGYYYWKDKRYLTQKDWELGNAID